MPVPRIRIRIQNRHRHRQRLLVVVRVIRGVQVRQVGRHTTNPRATTVTPTVTGRVDNTPIGIPLKIRVAVRGAV